MQKWEGNEGKYVEKSEKINIIILSLVGGWEARSWPAGEVEEGGGGKAGQEKEDWGQSFEKILPPDFDVLIPPRKL